jgi:hypothetical protein
MAHVSRAYFLSKEHAAYSARSSSSLLGRSNDRYDDREMDSTAEEIVERPSVFPLFSLPHELQCLILQFAINDGTSPTTLLCLSPHLYQDVISLLYSDIEINSKKQLQAFSSAISGSHKYAAEYARSFTFTIIGVPGGATQGGRESTPSSPRLRPSQIRQLDNRLLLASQAAQLCPKIEHCNFQMFGVRHSSLLTSNEYIIEEANAFQSALSGLKSLKSFSWTTAKEDLTVRGFSVAVVDLIFEPLIEGLEEAALDIATDGHRIARVKGDLLRYRHPLEQITLHNCKFPSDEGRKFFQLFAKTHPDDDEFLLFPQLDLICIRKAAHVNPVYVAFLALFWQSQIDFVSTQSRQSSNWNPILVMEDAYVGSIYGPKMEDDLIRHAMRQLLESCLCKEQEKAPSSNAYIRALEESVQMGVHLDSRLCERIRSMQQWQRDDLIRKACNRVHIKHIQGTIASYQ